MRMNRRRMQATPRSAFLPYPELVDPRPHAGPWVVEDSNDQDWLPTNGATDLEGKRLYVPLEPGAEGVALHEGAHVRWSPVRFPRVRYPLVCLQAVEDARINLALEKIGMPFTLDREQRAYVAHLAAQDGKSGDFGNTILRAIASLGTDAAEILREEVELLPDRAAEIGLRWLDEIGRRLSRSAARAHAPVAPFWVTRYLAKRLAHELVTSGLIGRDAQVPEFGCCHVTGVGAGDEGRRGAFVGLSRFEERIEEKRVGGRQLAVGRMKITRPPLALRQPSVLRGGIARSRCRTEGTQITRPDRKVLDGAIFGRGPSGGGGTVLVDASGSMSLSAEEVEAIVKAAGGAAVVAMYSGRADVGELRIVASGDRRVTNDRLEPYGSGNVIDLPALEWLSRQPSPRFWISDGCVTGVGDEGCPFILDRCREVVKRGRITRVEDAKAALEALA